MKGLSADEVLLIESEGQEVSHLRPAAESLVLDGRVSIVRWRDGHDYCILTPAGHEAYRIHRAIKASEFR